MPKFVITILLGMAGGFIGGLSADSYKSVLFDEAPGTPVVVLNIDELIEREKDAGADDSTAMIKGLEKAKAIAGNLKTKGYVVLTQGSIIDAPEALIVPQSPKSSG